MTLRPVGALTPPFSKTGCPVSKKYENRIAYLSEILGILTFQKCLGKERCCPYFIENYYFRYTLIGELHICSKIWVHVRVHR